MSADTIADLCPDEPVYRTGIRLAHDLDAICTSGQLSAAMQNMTHDGRWFVANCDPHLAFVHLGRLWNVICCRVEAGGWKVTGSLVKFPNEVAS